MNFINKTTLKNLQDMNEYEFEKLVADLWKKKGWSTTVTSASNDSGIDVIAEKRTPFYQKQLIQAKRYSSNSKIGSPDIQQYSSLKHQKDDVDSVVVITTGDFTDQAQDAASDLNVKIINGNGLMSIINTHNTEEILKKYEVKPGYSTNIAEKLNECRQTLHNNSGTPQALVHLSGILSGYSIIPQVDDSCNIHAFHNNMNNLGEFDEDELKKIGEITDNTDLEILRYNKDVGYIFVGEKGNRIPEKDEMISVMHNLLFSIFSASTRDATIVIEDFNE